jgi:uncharacterized protein YndB with AHSA1/START domain
MLKFGFRQTIARPVEDVFDYSSDPQHFLSSDPTAVVERTSGDLRAGSKFKVHFDDGQKHATVEVIEYDPPNYFEFEAHIDKPLPYLIQGKHTCTESEDETEMHADVKIQDVPAMMEVLIREKIRVLLQANFESMKLALEERNERIRA